MELLVAEQLPQNPAPQSTISPTDWDPAAFILAQQQRAQAAAVTSLNDDPEQAAHAIEVGKAAGVPAPVAYGNLDNIEAQHKAALTAELLRSNQFLAQYANSDPMAAKVSNDDWGQLDKVSQALSRFHSGRAGQILSSPGSVLGAAGKGFLEGLETPGSSATAAAEAGYGRFLSSLAGVADFPGQVFGGVVEGARAGFEQLQKSFGADPNAAERRSREFAGLVEAELGGLTGRHPVGEPAAEATQAAMQSHVAEAVRLAKPYLDQGLEPPVGLHPLIDQLHAEQSKLDVKNLDEVFKEAQQSATKGRSPDLFANFIAQHTDARIGISADAVRKLYGEKEPEPEDGKLGWLPDIAEQLRTAEASGGDIEVPLSDWLAKADPEVAKELHDDIRFRPGGMTVEESKGGQEPVKLEQPEEATLPAEVTPVDSIRAAARLESPLEPGPKGWDVVEPALPGKGIVPSKTILGQVELTGAETHTFKATDALAEVDSKQLNPVARSLYTFLGDRLNKMAGDTPVWVVDKSSMDAINTKYAHPPNTPAFYSGALHAIVMRDDIATGVQGHSVAAHILFHEVVHAATARELDEFPSLKSAVRLLMDEADTVLQRAPEIRQRHNYAFKNEKEFVAEAFSKPDFQQVLSVTPLSKELAAKLKLGKGKTVWDAFIKIIKGLVSRLAGREVPDSIMDGLLRLGPTFEEANRRVKESLGEGTSAAEPIQPELPGITRLEDRDLFAKAAAIGMTKPQYERYMKLIEKKQAEDLEFQKKQAEARAREQQTSEWKENYSRIRAETAADIRSRPDVGADLALREGTIHGQKVGKVRLARAEVDPELGKQLPRDYLGDSGVHPDDLAGLFSYQSGDQMVRGLARLEQDRQLEGLTPAAHLSKLIDAETDRQMRKTYGSLEQNILEEAKDHVISQTQLDLLHEEMLALGTKAHGEMSISKEAVKSWVKGSFNDTTLGAHSTDKYLAQAGRAGQAAEDALLKGDAGEAFKQKQRQYISMLLANEAKKLEKERGAFDKIAKRYSRREISGTPAEYTNWVHDILLRTGNQVRRSVQDLQEAIGRETHNSLEDFVNAKNQDSRVWEDDPNHPSDFQVMPVAPFLFDQAYRKTLDQMTPGEFRAVSNSVKTLIQNGRDERKITIAGEKEDLNETIEKMVGQLEAIFKGKEKQYAFGHKDQGIGHAVRTYWASLLQIESIFNRFDRGDPKGIFRRAVTEPIFEGAKELHSLETKYSRMYKALPDFGNLKKKVENPIFGDPLQDGAKGPMTRGNLLAVLQNVGNPSQLDKLVRGFKIEDPNTVMQWLFKNTTKEDWDRAQAMGDIFEQAFEESSRMYHNLSGVSPEKIDIRPIQTPFGEYKGWYHPIIYDPLRPGSSKKLMGQNPLEDGSYYRAATPSGYTKKRTGYAALILLSFDAIPARLKQMLNDIAMRPAVTEAAKVFYDSKFQIGITKYYGKEAKDLLLPYLKDIAGQKQYKDAAQTTALRVLEAARQNVVATLIGLNPSTVMKHGPTAAMLSMKEVGPKNFLHELTGLLSMNDQLGERNWTFAMHGGEVDGKPWGGSEELQRRQRNWQETLSGAQADLFKENTLRNTVIKLGATPVAISDLLSAVPTWLAAYKQQIRAGEEHGDAVGFADRAVRRAHGSSAVAARPRIMRGGPLAQFATPFYTFFNEMFQRQYEMAWRAKDALEGRSLEQERSGDYKAGLKEVPNLMGGLWAYVVFPALVEQMVSPVVTGNEPESVKIAAWGARTVASSLPVLRDMVEAFIGGRDPTVGLYSTGVKMLTDIGRDIGKGPGWAKAHAGTMIKHTATAFGALSGLTNAQEGRTGEYVYDYATGKQRPRDIGDILRGLWHGQQKERR